MTTEEFEKMAVAGLAAVPDKFRDKIKNVALLVEEDVPGSIREEQGLDSNETLLGLYHGVPQTARGDGYGVGPTLPDTITLFMKPIFEVAAEEGREVFEVINETIWHEVAHHFGLDEDTVRRREGERNLRHRHN